MEGRRMSKAPAMPVFTDALVGDTLHLSAEEFGAYFLILIATWRNNGQALPDDDARLRRVTRITPRRWPKVREILLPFFTTDDGFWHQARLEKEWNRVTNLILVKRACGDKGGRPRGATKALKINDTE